MVRRFLVVALVLSVCDICRIFADDAIPSATTQQVEQAVERGIGYVQTESSHWLSTRKCAACHHVPMVWWSLSEAERQGYSIDKKFVSQTVEDILGSPEKLVTSKLFNEPGTDPEKLRPIDKGVKTATAFIAVAARTLPSLEESHKQTLRVIADEIINKQRDDGSWEFFLSRPPINESETTDGAWIVMALQGETGPDASESQRAALTKALNWITSSQHLDNLQDKIFKILIADRAGKPRAELQSTIDEVLSLQQPNGGWRQNPEMPVDAYATGQSLYVLSLIGASIEQPQIKRAVDFLVATQKPDGSWPMTSRSTPDGKPGSSKLLTPITCTASAWATLSLSRLVPKSQAKPASSD